MAITLVMLALFLSSAVTCHVMAKSRGHDAVFWGVMGATFGPLAIPALLLVPVRVRQQRRR